MASSGVKQEPRAAARAVMPVIYGGVIALVVSMALLLLLAAVVILNDLPEGASTQLSCAAFAGGALGGGFMTCRLHKSRGLLMGALTGLLFFFVLYVAGAISQHIGLGTLAFVKLGLSLVFGALGGVIGVNTGRRRGR